jgi:hypothetical protein
MHLTVIEPFGDFQRGDKIKEPEKVDEILKGDNSRHVVKTADAE